MIQYTIRRLLASIPVLFGILAVTFALARSIPGNPCKAILGEKVSQATCDRFMEEKGFNEPIYVQFGIYIQDVVRGDLEIQLSLENPL
jgi:peptide/nickel transport system permease protein